MKENCLLKQSLVEIHDTEDRAGGKKGPMFSLSATLGLTLIPSMAN